MPWFSRQPSAATYAVYALDASEYEELPRRRQPKCFTSLPYIAPRHGYSLAQATHAEAGGAKLIRAVAVWSSTVPLCLRWA